MDEIETLGILEDIESLVSDNLQVVSYKWLSRNFMVSSDAAKRLLQQFVQEKGSNLEVVYTLSGWLKNNPSFYHIRLVSRSKLEEAKQDFGDNCSVQVYSVQSCIPRDSASLWNAEFVQTEELFKQASTVNNCLRDNRFCGISNSYVKRNVEGAHVGSSLVLNKSSANPGPSISASAHKTASVPQPQQGNHQQSNPSFDQQYRSEVKDLKGSLNINADKGSKPDLKEENDLERESGDLSRKEIDKNGMLSTDKAVSHNPETNAPSKDKSTGAALNPSSIDCRSNNNDQIHNHIEEAAAAKDKINAAPSSPKRRRVLKTPIDDREREVIDAFWEGHGVEARANSNTTIKAGNNAVSTENRGPAPKKLPAAGIVAPSNPVSKAGNKKGGKKDPKQGNILSFYKKV